MRSRFPFGLGQNVAIKASPSELTQLSWLQRFQKNYPTETQNQPINWGCGRKQKAHRGCEIE